MLDSSKASFDGSTAALLRERLLPRLCSAELIGAIAMTEPGTGSDLQAIRTTARLDDDHYLLNGAKTFITNGQNANLVIVVARTDIPRKSLGTS